LGKKDDAGAQESARARSRRELVNTVRDVVIAALAVMVLLATLYAYCGVWPPMVVIESNSMMHGEDSQIGVIDTGDLTLVKHVDDRGGIVTYVEAANRRDPNFGFRTYGDLGNVIIYKKSGLAGTPVIHRAIAWLEYNASASDPAHDVYKGDLPDIGVYAVTEYTVTGLKSYYPGQPDRPLVIHISTILLHSARSSRPHDGFLTKGDHNPIFDNGAGVDQEALQTAPGVFVEPVRLEWVIGRAEGELPWFGLIKLWISGQPSQTFPPTSVRALVATILLLIVVPMGVDLLFARYRRTRKDRREARKKQ
jgi:signal peptidase